MRKDNDVLTRDNVRPDPSRRFGMLERLKLAALRSELQEISLSTSHDVRKVMIAASKVGPALNSVDRANQRMSSLAALVKTVGYRLSNEKLSRRDARALSEALNELAALLEERGTEIKRALKEL
ncbi:hypothetical protein N5W20_07210 [Candidatus Kirkpatrickella diaphorinae]|uniref:Mobilization protein n=1 Tax=Candidatus Kirkpatrickella diaphorinae TaxID=2984322 RepID=A0ABY6GHU5_9PROT|nr:hypothetical protein [Candidatus Kirkpatrickella diaphorinae]UYH50889.1 hypothetical protein N5W20_07210 [Candidatus Kirkpatrickella diaphorinae]